MLIVKSLTRPIKIRNADVLLAMKLMVSGKAPDEDGIRVKIYVIGGNVLVRRLWHLFVLICKKGSVLQEPFSRPFQSSIFQERRKKAMYNNDRYIIIFSVDSNGLTRIYLNRIISDLVDKISYGSQCTFKLNRECFDIIYCLS